MSGERVHALISVFTYLLAFAPFILIACLQYSDKEPPITNIAGLSLQWNTTNQGTWQFWNWHPMLMTTGFGLLASHAIISFKALPFSHEVKKAIHAVTHIAAFASACVALSVVVLYKNATGNSHLFTTHAWIGIGAFGLYGLQIILGIFFFVVPKPAQRIRAAFLPIHTFAGVGIYALTTAAIFTGLMDRIMIQGVLTYTPLNPIWRGANFLALALGFTFLGVLWHTRSQKKKSDDDKYTAINAVGTLDYN